MNSSPSSKHPLRILIAPNAFKHSLDADKVAFAIQTGLRRSRLPCVCECFPIGDGGDGTGELIRQKYNGDLVSVIVHDPLMRPTEATYGLIHHGETAVIEMASASGIRLLKPDERDPLRATSFGTGELIKHALSKGVKKIMLAVGGSATVDGGTGILRALGVRFMDRSGNAIVTPSELINVNQWDVSGLNPRVFSTEFIVLCDVENILLGNQGAASVFGPQKGATLTAVDKLEAGLAKLAQLVRQQTSVDIATIKHGGAAGGVAAGLHAALKAQLVNGIDFFLDFTGFSYALAKTDLVITGEGSIDEQTLHGKGPYGVARQAKQMGLPVVGLAGRIPLDTNESLSHFFDLLLAIGNSPTSNHTALQNTERNLIRTAQQVGNLLQLTRPNFV